MSRGMQKPCWEHEHFLISKHTQELTCQVRLLCPRRQTLHLEAPATGGVSISRAVCVLRCCEVRLLQVPGR